MKQSLTMFHSMHAMVYSYQFWVIPGTFLVFMHEFLSMMGKKLIQYSKDKHTIPYACAEELVFLIGILLYRLEHTSFKRKMREIEWKEKMVTFLIRHRKYTSNTLLNGWLRFLMFLLNVTMWIYNYYFGKKNNNLIKWSYLFIYFCLPFDALHENGVHLEY